MPLHGSMCAGEGLQSFIWLAAIGAPAARGDDVVGHKIEYRFRQGGQEIAAVAVGLDGAGMMPELDEPGPDWTSLSFRQCPNCPLCREPDRLSARRPTSGTAGDPGSATFLRRDRSGGRHG